jgi:very-short-patch-repair endonuclease
MPKEKIITHQSVSSEKYIRSKELRREMTPAECRLWQFLRAARLEGYHFRRQQIIDKYIVDFYCHQADLVVEVDGGVHQEQEEYDRRRDETLIGRGLTVLRDTNQEVNQNLSGVLALILEACLKGKGKET